MAKKTQSKKRNRAAQDATLINLRALKNRVFRLETSVVDLKSIVARLLDRFPTVGTIKE